MLWSRHEDDDATTEVSNCRNLSALASDGEVLCKVEDVAVADEADDANDEELRACLAGALGTGGSE